MEPLWRIPLADLPLSKKDVHIWRAALDLPSRSIQELKEKLSIDELVRAERFRFERDRNRFIVRLGILRTILGFYMGVEPDEVRFCYGNHGKPRLRNAFGKTGINFNLSHSEGLALYVFSRDHEIGIDVERIHDIPEMEEIVERFFSGKENVVFRALPRSKKREAFFNCWTRKEAFIKAIGEGLFYPLDKFDVSFTPDEPSRLLSIDGDSEKASQWFMLNLKPASGFSVAQLVERVAVNH